VPSNNNIQKYYQKPWLRWSTISTIVSSQYNKNYPKIAGNNIHGE